MGRGRTGGSRRGGRAGGGGIPWLGLGLLLVIGVAVVAARTTGFSSAEQARSAEPTLSSGRQAATSTHAAGGTAQPKTTAGAPAVAAAPTAVWVAPAAPNATPTPPSVASTPTIATGTATLRTPTPGDAPRPTPAPVPALPGVGSAAGVALTFDAGADRGYAEDILDVLQAEHVLASFGITGQWAKTNPDLVRRMAADGHMVVNHTLDHRSFTGVSDQRGGLSAARRRAELDDADAIIAPLLGHSTQPWYRLPYGDDDAQVSADVRPAGYTHKVGWTVDSLGWRGAQATDIVARCLSLAAPGGVYVLHVGHASQDAIALPQIVRGLRDKGFSFHRVDQG
ncbi:MAG: polysaccharide deacetylase family protein [Chloroflexota bacterium]|nr:polysaccharide deacetylase family protein [Chloroflexota bacterium]